MTDEDKAAQMVGVSRGFYKKETNIPRITITILDQMLKQINQAAATEHLSRSAFFQKAAPQYLDTQKPKKEANNRKQRMTQAASNMDKPAGKFGKWDEIEIIRRIRDQRAGGKR